jgi:protein-tyrosine phosphatase
VQPSLFVIETPTPGRLATMAHPTGGTALAGELAALRAAGVDLLVCAQEDAELAELDLLGLPAAASAAGLVLRRFPIADNSITDDMPGAIVLAGELAEALRQGQFVVTHCWAGIGRSSMLAGAALVRLGGAPDEVWARIAAARGRSVPDNPIQYAWLHEFASAL